jgi:hypothetical protein
MEDDLRTVHPCVNPAAVGYELAFNFNRFAGKRLFNVPAETSFEGGTISCAVRARGAGRNMSHALLRPVDLHSKRVCVGHVEVLGYPEIRYTYRAEGAGKFNLPWRKLHAGVQFIEGPAALAQAYFQRLTPLRFLLGRPIHPVRGRDKGELSVGFCEGFSPCANDHRRQDHRVRVTSTPWPLSDGHDWRSSREQCYRSGKFELPRPLLRNDRPRKKLSSESGQA